MRDTFKDWPTPPLPRPASERCDRPTPGWYCNGDRGHEGPCAAWPYDIAKFPKQKRPMPGWLFWSIWTAFMMGNLAMLWWSFKR